MPKSIVQWKRNQGFGAKTTIIIMIIIGKYSYGDEARGFEAKIMELGIETMKIEFRASDLAPEGSEKKSCGQIRNSINVRFSRSGTSLVAPLGIPRHP